MSVLAFKIGCPSACIVAFRRRVASGSFGFAELGTGKAGGVESYGFFGCKLQATASHSKITVHYGTLRYICDSGGCFYLDLCN